MTLRLNVTPQLGERLALEARRLGLPVEQYTLQLLDRHAPPAADQRERLVALLQTWIDHGDEAEQRETGEYLVRALDADRPSDRKLYPPELKGVTW